MLNTQPIEKIAKGDGSTVDVHSIFPTIQGEGPFSGRRAVFVRLAGCNLQCPLCDTEYTEGRQRMTPQDVVSQVTAQTSKTDFVVNLVVITGGEPLRQPIGPLVTELTKAGLAVQIETNGTLAPPPGIRFNTGGRGPQACSVYLVCSPKTGKVHPKIWEVACCVKYVLSADSRSVHDWLPLRALGHVANPMLARPPEGWGRPVYLQPADHKDPVINQRNMDACVESVKKFGYTLQLQIHKYLGVE